MEYGAEYKERRCGAVGYRSGTLARESKTEAIRRALEERKRSLELEVVPQALGDDAFRYLEREV